MAVCPHCEQPIDHLVAVVDERNVYRFSPGDEEDEYEFADRIEFNVETFKCPHCKEPVPDSSGDVEAARMFLTINE